MTTSLARTARPPSAAIAWVQGDRLFVELPTHTGVPYICTYKRTLEGLTAALNILIENSDVLPPIPQTGGAKPHPAVRKLATFTDDQRAGVRAILKDKGIL